jgi:HlyD family secretion protein
MAEPAADLNTVRTRRAAAGSVAAMDRRVAPAPRFMRRLAWACAGLVAIGLIIAGYLHFASSRIFAVGADHLVLSSVRSGNFYEYIPATATVAARTTAYLDAVEGGQVAEKLVDKGAHVERGQALVRLKNTNLELEVLGRQAQLMEQLDRLNSTILSFQQARLGHDRELIDARSQVQQLALRLKRYEALGPSGGVSMAQIDETRIDLDHYQQLQTTMKAAQTMDSQYQTRELAQLRDAIKATRENLSMAGETLNSLTVRAPIAGQLTAIDADLGAAKAAGQRIGQIDDANSYKAEAGIDEFYLGRVTPGEEASADIDGNTLRMQVSKVYPQVLERQFKVDLVFLDSIPQGLHQGQTLQVRIGIGGTRKSLVVGNGPFYEDTGGTWAFVLAPGATEAHRRTVQLGRRNPEQIEVIGGVATGDRVITSSYESLRAYDRIRLSGDISKDSTP